jgi:hypothetical protein
MSIGNEKGHLQIGHDLAEEAKGRDGPKGVHYRSGVDKTGLCANQQREPSVRTTQTEKVNEMPSDWVRSRTLQQPVGMGALMPAIEETRVLCVKRRRRVLHGFGGKGGLLNPRLGVVEQAESFFLLRHDKT